jgi:hypothetical protein
MNNDIRKQVLEMQKEIERLYAKGFVIAARLLCEQKNHLIANLKRV